MSPGFSCTTSSSFWLFVQLVCSSKGGKNADVSRLPTGAIAPASSPHKHVNSEMQIAVEKRSHSQHHTSWFDACSVITLATKT